MPKKDVTFKPEVLLKLSEWVKPDKNNKYELRVVRWLVNGEPKTAKIEKRSFYVEQNQWKMGKIEGLSYADLKVIKDNMPAILDIMNKYDTAPKPSTAVDAMTGKAAETAGMGDTALPF